MQNKVVVITGGFGVLGRAAAEEALAQGARVALIDYAAAPADLNKDILAFAGVDLTDAAAATRTMNAVADKAGAIDALLNIAGGFIWKRFLEAEPADWDRMRAINLTTNAHATKAALPHLTEAKGAIVNVGANGAVRAGAGMGPYASAKSGVHRLTESLAEELKGKVRVNAVLPSILDTPQNRADMPAADPATWVQPRELAKVMLFLASGAASAVTGALIPVTGRV